MKRYFVNNIVIVCFAAIFCLASLLLSHMFNDVEWFQASGAVVTLCGNYLSARKLIRLGPPRTLRGNREWPDSFTR